MMGKSKFSAITMMMCTDVTEACTTNDATAWATALSEQCLTAAEHTTCDTDYLTYLAIIIGIIATIMVINALTDLIIDNSRGRPAPHETIIQALSNKRPKSTIRDENEPKRMTAIVLTIMLMTSTITTTSANQHKEEPTPENMNTNQTIYKTNHRTPKTGWKAKWMNKGHASQAIHSHSTANTNQQPFNNRGDGPLDPYKHELQQPLDTLISNHTKNMHTPNKSLKYICANVLNLQTPHQIKKWQDNLTAMDADFAILIGTKLTTKSNNPYMFPGYKIYNASIVEEHTWVEAMCKKVVPEKGVAICIKERYSTGEEIKAEGDLRGRPLALTLYPGQRRNRQTANLDKNCGSILRLRTRMHNGQGNAKQHHTQRCQ
jgi:hypothetical protein